MSEIVIRPLLETDLDEANEISMAAYNVPYSRRAELQRYLRLQPDGWLLASLAGTPVGFGGLVDYGPFAYLGLMSVLPALQGRGVGKALVQQLLDWSDARGCPTVLLDASQAGAPLYVKFGFVEEGKTATWGRDPQLPLPDLLTSHTVSFLSTLQARDLSPLATFDAHYFGAERAAVISSFLADSDRYAMVAHNTDGELAGYLIMRNEVGRPAFLGPWVASSVDVAEQLLRYALSLPVEGGFSLNVSLHNCDASKLLAHYGFQQLRALSYMRRGRLADFRDLTHIYGQASFALG